MRIIILVLMIFTLGIWNTQAQTFSPEYDDGETADTDMGRYSSSDADDEDDDAAADDEYVGGNASTKSDEVFVPATVNIGAGEQKRKVYDNSEGHVFEYKYVNGKIIFTEPEDRKILVFIDNYKAEKGMNGIVKCNLRVYVLNDMVSRLNNLSFKLIWPEIRTSIQMQRVNPGVKTYKDIMLLGEGCFSIDKTPTLEVNRCRVKGKTQEQCARAVRWFQK